MSQRGEIEKLYALGKYALAVPLAEDELTAARDQFGLSHPETARAINDVAVLYDALARYDDATALYRQALGIREQTLGADHPDTATSLINLAHACYRLAASSAASLPAANSAWGGRGGPRRGTTARASSAPRACLDHGTGTRAPRRRRRRF